MTNDEKKLTQTIVLQEQQIRDVINALRNCMRVEENLDVLQRDNSLLNMFITSLRRLIEE